MRLCLGVYFDALAEESKSKGLGWLEQGQDCKLKVNFSFPKQILSILSILQFRDRTNIVFFRSPNAV